MATTVIAEVQEKLRSRLTKEEYDLASRILLLPVTKVRQLIEQLADEVTKN